MIGGDEWADRWLVMVMCGDRWLVMMVMRVVISDDGDDCGNCW